MQCTSCTTTRKQPGQSTTPNKQSCCAGAGCHPTPRATVGHLSPGPGVPACSAGCRTRTRRRRRRLLLLHAAATALRPPTHPRAGRSAADCCFNRVINAFASARAPQLSFSRSRSAHLPAVGKAERRIESERSASLGNRISLGPFPWRREGRKERRPLVFTSASL